MLKLTPLTKVTVYLNKGLGMDPMTNLGVDEVVSLVTRKKIILVSTL